jgi:hypothetical protein
MSWTRLQIYAALLAARARSEALLLAHIEALWAAKSDPEAARALRISLRQERDGAHARLRAATDPLWWEAATPDTIGAVYEGSHLWSRADPDCRELETLFLSTLRTRFRIRLDDIPSSDNPRGYSFDTAL